MFDVHKMKYSLSKKKMEVYNGVTLYLYNGVFVKIRFVLVGFCITIYIYRYGEMKCFNTYKKYFFNGCKN